MEYDPEGNIFDGNLQCIVDPVNCYGRMGKGLAKSLAVRFPVFSRTSAMSLDSEDEPLTAFVYQGPLPL